MIAIIQVILVLRGLLLEDKQLESVMSLQSHLEERQQMGKLKVHLIDSLQCSSFSF